jgi:hypothetical protein
MVMGDENIGQSPPLGLQSSKDRTGLWSIDSCRGLRRRVMQENSEIILEAKKLLKFIGHKAALFALSEPARFA